MRIIADLHLHSKYSRAVSQEMVLPKIWQWAQKKGINLVGTGDWTHPLWLREIKANLEEVKDGLYGLKATSEAQRDNIHHNFKSGVTGSLEKEDVSLLKRTHPLFLLSTEISSIYSQGGKLRRIHNLVLVPSIEAAEKINKALTDRGANLISDGRPITGIPAPDLMKLILAIDENCLIIPAHCLLPDTHLEVNPGIKKIKDIEVGDKVLTHNGRYRRVKEIFTRDYHGEVFKVRPWYFTLGLTTTPEHPFLAIKTFKKCKSTGDICRPVGRHLNHCAVKHYLAYKKEWVEVNKLEPGDVILFPRLGKISDKRFIKISNLIDKVRKERSGKVSFGGRRKTLIPDKIPVDAGFLRLGGYYLAEGYTGGDDISFAFHEEEVEIIEDIKAQIRRLFGISHFREYKRKKGVELICHSKVVAKLFSKLFYGPDLPRRAQTKRLPFWMLYLSPIKQKEILKAWWLGDKGYTNSQVLLNQMKTLCLRLGIIPSIRVDTKEEHRLRGKHDKFEGREIRAKYDTFSIDKLNFIDDKLGICQDPVFSRFKTKLERRHGWMDEDFAYIPIRKIERLFYKGEVHNLEVEEDNSYVSEFATVHNCWTPWFSLYGSESGFDSIEECFGEMTKDIYAIETGLSCYDIQTEVLTNNGWKKFPEVSYDDEIYTLNLQTGEIEFQKPIKVHKYSYKGKMYRLKTKRVDLLVTPNHKLLYSPCDFRKPPKFLFKEAEFLFNKSKRFKKDGKWIGESPEYFVLPDVGIKHGSQHYSGRRKKQGKYLPIKPWLKFFGFWIAEGWTSEGKDGDYNICLANRNNTLLLEMKKILESFGYNVYWERKTNNTIRVRDYQLFHYLKQFGKCFDKFVPLEIKSLSKEFLEIFLEYYIKGDGHIYGRSGKGLSATTTSIQLRDDLQEIALKVGMSAYYKLHNKKGTPFKSPGYKYKRTYKQRNDSWVIFFIRRNFHTVLPSTVKKYDRIESWIDFNGLVYCVTVPNHTIYIRRNGIPVWCGNSDPAMNWRIQELDSRQIVSFSDAHSGPKLGREATVFELEKLSYENIKRAITQLSVFRRQLSDVSQSVDRLTGQPITDRPETENRQLKTGNRIAYTIEFYPEEGKYHFTGHRTCGIKQSPEETSRLGTTCPACGKRLTIGVIHRVEQLAARQIQNSCLAGRQAKFKIQNDELGIRWISYNARPPYVMLVPLQEILAEAIGGLPASQNVQNEYEKLVRHFGGIGEFGVLLETPLEEIRRISGEKVAEGIRKVRSGEIVIEPGYDGVFGTVKIWPSSTEASARQKEEKEQMSLF